jgi:hypothetical protein
MKNNKSFYLAFIISFSLFIIMIIFSEESSIGNRVSLWLVEVFFASLISFLNSAYLSYFFRYRFYLYLFQIFGLILLIYKYHHISLLFKRICDIHYYSELIDGWFVYLFIYYLLFLLFYKLFVAWRISTLK